MCLDDKRYVLDDGVNILAYFHKDCNKNVIKIKIIIILIIIMIIMIIMINDNDNNQW